jgi:hypothetical protein
MPLYFWFNHFLDSRAEFCLIFRSFFGEWSFKKKCFWDLLTFRRQKKVYQKLRKLLIYNCIQLNKYETDLYYLKLSQQMITDFRLLIYDFLLILAGCDLKIVLHWYENQNKTILWSCAVNPGKSSEILKQYHVISWLTYWNYNSVWWTLSCTTFTFQNFWSNFFFLLFILAKFYRT